MANVDFKKIDENCGNVFLIDENLCLDKSYDIITHNFETQFDNLFSLNGTSESFNSLYSNFSRNSASWITAIDNFQTLSAIWFSAETTTKNLSANWQKEIHLIYNKIIQLEDYYSPVAMQTYKNQIKDWISTNFNQHIPNGQIINIDVYLHTTETFTWDYYRQYYENCVPPNSIIPTTGCRCSRPNFSCNKVHVNGAIQNGGQCMNAAQFCGHQRSVPVGRDNVNCPNREAKYVELEYNKTSFDKSLARVITIRYIKEIGIIKEL